MSSFPLLPLRDIVVFPGMVVPLFVGRDKSVAALEVAMEGSKDIFLLAQLDPGCDDPARDDLYDVGVVAQGEQGIGSSHVSSNSVRCSGGHAARLLPRIWGSSSPLAMPPSREAVDVNVALTPPAGQSGRC